MFIRKKRRAKKTLRKTKFLLDFENIKNSRCSKMSVGQNV